MIGADRFSQVSRSVMDTVKADQIEVVAIAEENALTRFANNYVHQNVHESNVQVRIRAVVGKRIGVTATNNLEPGALRRSAEAAVEMAWRQPDNPDFQSLPMPGAIPSARTYSERTATFTPADRARSVKVVCDLAAERGLIASGAFETGVIEVGVANSLGVFAYTSATRADIKTVVMGDDGSGYGEFTSVDVKEIPIEQVAREAVDKALSSKDRQPVEPGEYPVILEEYAVEEMLSYLAYVGLGALSVQEGRSFMCDRFGQQIVGQNITLWDDGLDPTGLPMPFDFEGVPKQKVMLIENGIARGVVYDSYTAAREGRESTGHALPAPNTFGPFPANLFLATGQHTKQDMLTSVDRGIWVTRFWYVNVVQPKQVVLTGMTRDGTYLIEKGRLVRPVKDLRWTQNVLEALNNVEMVGRESKLLPGFVGGNRVPALKISRWRFTGVSEL